MVADQEVLLDREYGRLRAIVQGPDGLLYFTTSNRDGRGSPGPDDDRVLRLRPQQNGDTGAVAPPLTGGRSAGGLVVWLALGGLLSAGAAVIVLRIRREQRAR